MKRSIYTVVGGVTLGLVLATGIIALNAETATQQDRASASVPSGDVSKGRELYVKQGCYQCHGYVGQGSVMTGPALVTSRLDERALRDYVRSPKGVMPAYTAKVMSDDDLALLARFVKSLPIGHPPSDIPLLAPYVAASAANSPTSAQQLYWLHCAACHGMQREGNIGPDLRREATKRDASATLRLLLNPPPRMPKLSPEPLTVDQMKTIADFLRSP